MVRETFPTAPETKWICEERSSMVWDIFRRGRKDEAGIEAKASATGPVVAWQNLGRVAWSARDTEVVADFRTS
jgi:hypothetical protein